MSAYVNSFRDLFASKQYVGSTNWIDLQSTVPGGMRALAGAEGNTRSILLVVPNSLEAPNATHFFASIDGGKTLRQLRVAITSFKTAQELKRNFIIQPHKNPELLCLEQNSDGSFSFRYGLGADRQGHDLAFALTSRPEVTSAAEAGSYLLLGR